MADSNFLLKVKSNVYQIFKFGIVGFTCFIIDYIGLYVFAKIFNYLIAAAIAYCISIVFNYTLSMPFVFISKGGSKIKEATVFIILSLIGLGMTEMFMYLFTDIIGVHYMLSKVFSTAFVMVFSFITRKFFLEKKQ